MDAPLSNHWVVEFHFFQDAFSVRSLPDYLTHAQKSFHDNRFFDSVILAIHPNKMGAQEECSVWQDRRNKQPHAVLNRATILRRHLQGLEVTLE
jgi:hypothetical protein